MTRDVRFSVVIPAYNAERFVADALESVHQQTYSAQQVIVVDDGSTDGTPSILESYARSHERVEVVHVANSGPLLARREGIRRATGDYLVFLDADDMLCIRALERCAETIAEHHVDIVSFRFSRDPGFTRLYGPAFLPEGLYATGDYKAVREQACLGMLNELCGKAIRRACFDLDEDYGVYRGLMHGEDLFQMLPVIDEASSLYRMDEALYFYRPNDDSSTGLYRDCQLSDIVTVMRRMRGYASRWGGRCPEAAVRGEVRQYLFLLKIVSRARFPYVRKKEILGRVRSAMESEGVFARAAGVDVRPDYRTAVQLLGHRCYRALLLLLRAVDALKALLDKG